MQITRIVLAALLMCITAHGQYITYYIQGLHRQGTAQYARDYLGIYGSNIFHWGTNTPWLVITNISTNYTAGSNIVFTLTSPYSYSISGLPGGGVTNNFYYTNDYFFTNLYYVTNDNFYTNYYTNNNYYTNYYTNAVAQTNIWATNLMGFSAGTNIQFSTNGQVLMVNVSNQPVFDLLLSTNLLATNLNNQGSSDGQVLTATATGVAWSNAAAGPAIQDIRTNAFNEFTGTNQFDTNVYLMGHVGINFTNFGHVNYSPYTFVWQREYYQGAPIFNDGGAGLVFGGNTGWKYPDGNGPAQGVSITSIYDLTYANSQKPLFLTGSGIFIGGTANMPIVFVVTGGNMMQINGYGNLLGGQTDSSIFGTGCGGIGTTNFMYSGEYVKGLNGIVAGSNSWTKVPDFKISNANDNFNCGDIWIVSSNGWPYIVTKTPPGCTLWTNPLTQSEILSTTNFSLTVTNMYLSRPVWRDRITSGMALGAGSSAPSIITAGPGFDGLAIRGMGFSIGDDGHGTCQFNHDVAPTNSSFPNFYVEPHIHIAPVSLASGTNARFRFVYEWSNINGIYTNIAGAMTNTASFTNNYQHIMLEFGHITNNLAQGSLSSIMRFAIERQNSGAGDVGANDIVVDSVDIHYPVWRLGSNRESTD